MSEHSKRSFGSDFRRFFGRGLTILLPTVLTLWLLVQAYFFVDRQVAEPINRGIRAATLELLPRIMKDGKMPPFFNVTEEQVRFRRSRTISEGLIAPSDVVIRREIRMEQFKHFWEARFYLRFIGLLVAIILIYLAGLILGGFFGRRLYKRLEELLTRIPIFKQVYPHVKQVVDMLIGEKPMAFRKVVLVQYPREGLYTLGLVTSSSMRAVKDALGEEVYTVFIPSTPTPFTGFCINVKRSEVIDSPMSIDEAIRFFLTGGVLIPERQANPPLTDPPQSMQIGSTLGGSAAGKGGTGGAEGSVGSRGSAASGPESGIDTGPTSGDGSTKK